MVVTIDALADNFFCPANKIGEGTYREVYQISDSLFKVLKPFRSKSYGLFCIDFPMGRYTLLKFGIRDFNVYERDMYDKLISAVPEEYHRNFSTIYETGYHNGRSISRCRLISDSEGNISPSVAKYGQINNQHFWARLQELEEMFVDIGFFPMDLKAENILVGTNENYDPEPIFVDFKRVGARTYPFQIWLQYRKKLIERMRTKFRRLRDNYRS